MRTLQEEAIAQLVMSKLCNDQRTCGQTIDVYVVDGDLFLVGWCDKEEQKVAAEIIASGTYGIRTVIDKIQIRHISQSI